MIEDAVLHEAGIEMGVQAIVTRDANGFKHAAISVYEPEELLRMLGAAPKN